MKILCESMLVASNDNWLDLLRAADVLGSHQLHSQALGFLRDNISVLIQGNPSTESNSAANSSEASVELVTMLCSEFPGLIEKVIQERSDCHPLPPSKIYSTHIVELIKEASTMKPATSFPVVALIICIIGFILYQYMSNIHIIGSFVPVVNTVAIVSLAIFLFVRLNN